MCVSVSHSGGKTESIAVEEISYREKPYLHAVRQTHARASMRVMDYLYGLDISPGNKICIRGLKALQAEWQPMAKEK